jgi:hypothetical protein
VCSQKRDKFFKKSKKVANLQKSKATVKISAGRAKFFATHNARPTLLNIFKSFTPKNSRKLLISLNSMLLQKKEL